MIEKETTVALHTSGRNSGVGIRPQLIRADGHLVEDLVIDTTPRSVHVLNVVSPGMTSSIRFARWLGSRISNDLMWSQPQGMMGTA